MKARVWRWLVLCVVGCVVGASSASAQMDWLQPGVRVWYLGGVGDWDMSSNAEEAYLIQSVNGATATVKYHSALTHWTVPRPVEVGTASVLDVGPCWIHPQRLQTIQKDDYWHSDQRITLVERNLTYADLPYRLLPALALFDLDPQRQVVKITYKIDPHYELPTGSAFFDAATGLLLYHNSRWGGTKMFFILAEVNYDFARQAPFPEDNGPHTGFRSFVSERSQGVWTGLMFIGGGSITIQSMVESRYGSRVRMLVMPSIVPSSFSTAYRNFAFFGDVPIVRQMTYPQSANVRPEQWEPFGQHLWWWLPRSVTGALTAAPATPDATSSIVAGAAALPAINVFDVPMAKTADQPLTYTATQSPQRFHFTWLKFDADGYMTEFAAKDPTTTLHVQPGDFNYWNCWTTLQLQFGRSEATGPEYCVDGRVYFRDQMALPATPAPTVASIFPAAGPTSGGTPITITGTNFVAGATSVSIGGTLASAVSVQGPTSLTCVTPPGAAGPREVHVIVSGLSSTAPGTFLYADSAVVTPPADPSQPVTVSLPIPGGTMTATFHGVTSGGSLMAVPIDAPTPPMAQAVLLPATALFVDAPGVTYGSAVFCFPYDPAMVASTGVAEEHLMVWHQPPGSTAWVDVTASHDPSGNRVCARNSVSRVVLAGYAGGPLSHARYLAEGATSTFFDTTIALVNPSPSTSANAMLGFQRADASSRVRYLSVPPMGRRTVTVKAVPEMADAEFSTVIESDQPLVVDRTMSWDATGYGGHAETSVPAPASVWYLAEGATHGNFDLFYLLQNPNAAEAQVRVRYLRPDGAPLEKTYVLRPRSRTNIWVDYEEFPDGSGNRALTSTDVSAVLEVLNGQPIIVERAMYAAVPGQFFGAGHESTGITEPALEWFLAEGATGPYFDLFVLVANPSASDAQIEATYLLPGGTSLTKPYTVRANSRFNIWVDLEDAKLADTAVSTTVRSTNGVPIIVERAMWWPGNWTTWFEAHNSPGATTTGTRWALGEGEVDRARNKETYILVANTSASPADVKVTLLFEDGTTAARTYAGVPARSRFNVPVGVDFPQADGKRFGAIVESLGATPAQIVVERAMYWDAGGQSWAAGTNALATRLR